MKEANIITISDSTKLIEGSGRATVLLSGGTILAVNDALYCSRSQRNLLSFKDIRQNGYHIETTNEEKGKLIIRPSVIKVGVESPAFLEHYAIKTFRLDNASEFTSQAFNDYCISTGITIKHPVAHVHTQNGLGDSLIKRLQLIARPMLMRIKLPISAWGHAILHAAALVRIKPTNYHKVSSIQLAFAANAHIRIDVPVGQSINANESKTHLKRGRPIGSKDKNPRKRKGANDLGDHNMEAELVSLEKREVFRCIIRTPEGIKLVGYKWIFVRKRNDKNEVVRYKARLVAQRFSQRPVIDYMETYSSVVDAITFRYLINLAVHEKLDMRLMDVVTTYLYGTLDNEIYMKIPGGLKVPETNKSFRETYSIKLQKSLYGLKQSGRMWYNRLSRVFIRRSGSEFVIIAVYVDDLNIIGTPRKLPKAVDYLKKELEMKDLENTKFCLGYKLSI
ncbi:uncharacterized protein [Nicotiana tomentosiformis]|uniref:uncharacterized protein n=1 Tax=Nicotiana tomentosiformis TaxID=4098 RepID=UPI00388CBF7F